MSEFTVKRAKTRIDNGKIGEKIVEERLKELGWVVQNANEIMTNQPNFDLIAKKNNRLITNNPTTKHPQFGVYKYNKFTDPNAWGPALRPYIIFSNFNQKICENSHFNNFIISLILNQNHKMIRAITYFTINFK